MNTNWLPHLFIDYPLYQLPEAIEAQVGNKPLLVLVEAQDWNNQTADLLQKIVAAIKLEYNTQVEIVPVEEHKNYSFQVFRQQFGCEIVLTFNVPLSKIGIYFELSKYLPLYHANIRVLVADALSVVSSDKELKASLWNGLKALINSTTKAS